MRAAQNEPPTAFPRVVPVRSPRCRPRRVSGRGVPLLRAVGLVGRGNGEVADIPVLASVVLLWLLARRRAQPGVLGPDS
jgi:hypothetical protein